MGYAKLRNGCQADAKLIIKDLEEKLGTLDCFRFLEYEQIEKLIKNNYTIDKDTLFCVIVHIMLKFYGKNEFQYHKNKKERITLEQLKESAN